MSTFYLDYELGNDSTTSTPLGWWSVVLSSPSGTQPAADETMTGATSGATAKLTIAPSAWTGTPTIYFYGKSGTFQSETVNFSGGGSGTISADLTYCAWKTITSGATAARIAPGDIIRIAKSPVPASIGNATWTNLSKTVTLATAQTANIETCEVDWTEVNATSSDKLAVATDAKEGSYCVKIVEDATPAADEVQAYSDIYTHDTTVHDLSAYQKISFWIKNEVAILANQLEINLCSNANGTGDVDVFPIPAIPSTGKWVPLTIARNGGGNLGNAIKSINISNGSNATTYTASKYVYLDNIIACTTDGLNLQSLISKNSLEQGGTEGWYCIQSINGTTVLLDTTTATKANAGLGYCGATETVTSYKRETIKTAIATNAADIVQEVKDVGNYGNNIQFQGGYDTSTGNQTGETFFDGLNNNGYGLQFQSIEFVTLNYFNFCRYNYGIYFFYSNRNTILTLSNINNNHQGFYFNYSGSNNVTKISNANNITNYGIYFNYSSNNNIEIISNANSNARGISYSGASQNNIIGTVSLINNSGAGLYFDVGTNNIIKTLLTSSNSVAIITGYGSRNYIYNATITESSKISFASSFDNCGVFITKLNSDYSTIYTEGGNIISQASTLTNGSGTEWKFTTETNTNRKLNYPLKLNISKVAVVANKEVTVTCYFKKGHATNIGARLVFPAQLGEVEHYADCPNDTNENNLSIAFTPTEAGVIEIEAWAYYIAGHSNVIVDAMTITQA